MPEVSLSGINFTIKGTTDSASDSVKTLIDRLNDLNTALSNAGNVKVVARSLGSLKKSLDGLSGAGSKGAANALKSISEAMESFKSMSDVSKNLASFARNMNKLAENKDDRLSALSAWLAKIATIDFSNLEKAGQGIKQIADAAAQITKGKGGGEAQSTHKFLDVLKKDITSVASAMWKLDKAMLKGAGKGLLSGAKGVGNIFAYPFKSGYKSVSGYVKGLTGVVGGFKRIVGYRIIRTIIKEITQGFMEGTNNLYAWSTLVGGTFAKNMDDAATSMLYFKNSIGAAWSPLMNILAPALRVVTDAAVDLLNVINQLLARLTGQSSWTRAKRVATEYGDAVSGAGQAAKEALRYLAPFDELNVLPGQKDGGSGGGAADNASEMFEEVATFSEGIADFADKVREAIQSSNWTGLGILLGEKVNEVVENLDWSAGGTKVGKGINAWFTTKYWTLETVNFQNIGSRVAEFLNSAIGNIDFNIIGRSLTQKFTILGDFILGAVENLDWAAVGNSIRDFLVGAFNQMSQWGKKIDWNEFGTTLYNSLTDLLSGLDFGGIASSFFSLLGTALGAGVSLISGFLSGLWEDIKSYFTRFIDTDAENDVGQQVVWGLLAGVWNAVKELGSWVKEHIFDPFLAAVKKVFGIHSPAAEMEEPGQMIGEGILEGLAKPFKDIGAWIKEHILDPIKEKLKGFSLTKLLFGDENNSGTAGCEIEVTGIKDNIPLKDKIINGVKALFGSTDGTKLTLGQKIVNGVRALFESTDKSKLTAAQKTVNTYANFTAVKNALTDAQKTIKTWAQYTASKMGLSEGARTIKTWANYTASKLGLSDAARTINTWANYADSKLSLSNAARTINTWANYAASKLGLSNGDRTINTWANYVATKLGLNNDQRTINTWSNFVATKLGLNENQRTIGTWANYVSALFNLSGDDRTVNTWANYVAALFNLSEDDRTINVNGKITYAYPDPYLQTPTIDVNARITGAGGNYTMATGGAFYGNRWHEIPQAASGGNFHGTLFWAGEAGPEIVGRAGGRTEVLNRSQLAATMYAAVKSAMSGFRFNVSSMNVPSSSGDSYDYEAIYQAVVNGIRDSGVGDEEITLDGDVLYRKMVQRNQMNTRMTGRNVMATA